VLDVLFQRPDGSWVVVDYKTSHVAGYVASPDNRVIVDHAGRYHLQVGVYAAAVREHLNGVTPAVYIHYIRYQRTVQVATVEWETALANLEAYIGRLLGVYE
jgi:ATP-dependent exoDNAse (exonuclease V) beta subunit